MLFALSNKVVSSRPRDQKRKKRALMIMFCLSAMLLTSSCLLLSLWAGQPALTMSSGSASSKWELAHSKDYMEQGKVQIVHCRSKRSGMHVVVAETESPIVEVNIVVPTEVFSDDGAPHVLEHLLFHRSRDYPYKNFMRLTAPKFLAGGLNAGTYQDYTKYYYKAAGSDGALRFLSLYLNQMLYSSLTEGDVLTEAHHVDEDGVDGGVVYSEMKGLNEDTGWQLSYRMREILYPGNSSYAYNRGGTLEALGTLDRPRLVDYHARFYRLENVLVVVEGGVKAQDVVDSLDGVEERAAERGADARVGWDDTGNLFRVEESVGPVEDVEEVLLYASADESLGRVGIGRRLPPDYDLEDHIEDVLAFNTFLSPYLRDALVTGHDSISTSAAVSATYFRSPYVLATFKNVPVDRMDEVEDRVDEVVRKQLEGGFNLLRMRNQIEATKRRSLADIENLDLNFFESGSTRYFLYHSLNSTEDRWDRFLLDDYDYYLDKDEAYWTDLIRTYLTGPRVLIKAVPSKKLRNEEAEKEAAKVQKNKDRLGEEGLKLAGEELKAAIAKDVKPPNSVFESFPQADVSTIQHLPISPYNFTSNPQPPNGFALRAVPFPVHVDDVESQYLRFSMFLNFSSVVSTSEDLFYLYMLAVVWDDSPLMDEQGTLIPTEKVYERERNVTVSFGIATYDSSTEDSLQVKCQAELNRYSEAVDFTGDVLFDVKFDEKKVKSYLSRVVSRYDAWKTSETGVMGWVADAMTYRKGFVGRLGGTPDIIRAAEKIQRDFERDETGVLDRMEEMRSTVLRPENAFLHVAVDLEELEKVESDPSKAWVEFFSSRGVEGEVSKDQLTRQRVQSQPKDHINDQPKYRNAIAANHQIQSCYVEQSVPFPTGNPLHPDYPATELALDIIHLEIRNTLRTRGLLYSFNLNANAYNGLVTMKFYRASNVAEAHSVFRSYLRNYTSPSPPWDRTTLDNFKGSAIYAKTARDASVGKMVPNTLFAVWAGYEDYQWARKYPKRIQAVTLEDLNRVARKYLSQFLDKDRWYLAVSCHASKVDRVAEELGADLGVDFLKVDDEQLQDPDLFP